jgi:transcriptional regulator with XRE-family HTH domain
MTNHDPAEAGDSQRAACTAIVERIEHRMRALGIRSEAEVGRLAGLSRDVVRDIRRGKYPGLDKLFALARALQCDSDWLAYGASREHAVFDPQRMYEVLVTLAEAGVYRRLSPELAAEWAILVYEEGRGPLSAEERAELLPRIDRAFRLGRES